MREILDGIDTEPLNEAFVDLFWELQRGRELKQWLYDGKYYLVAIDGPGYFCSDHIKCDHCMVRRINGKEQYYDQVVAAVLVHPITKQVIPLAIEPIIRSDGNAKNDCERNATGRLLRRLRQQHPKLDMLSIENGLSSNAPHIADLEENKMRYLLGVKPGDHQHLFDQVIEKMEDDNYRLETHQVASAEESVRTETNYISSVSLNKSHADVQVNFLQHHEFNLSDGVVIEQFSWVTDIDLSQKDLYEYQKAGRCR